MSSTTRILILLASIPLPTLAAHDADLLVGDIAQVLVPATALAATYYFSDSEGRLQWMKNTAATLVATEALKYGLNSTSLSKRPNGGDRGFPSGHTSAACSGAFFMANRYGWQYAAPGLIAAAFTGYSRVDEGYHHWRDVIAGCGLAYATSYYFVNSAKSKLVITPEIGRKFTGLKLATEF